MKLSKILVFVASLGLLVYGGSLLFKKRAMESVPETPSEVGSVPTDPSAGTVEAGSPAPIISPGSETFSATDQQQIQVLKEILETKNDNDPRMDRMLKNLSVPVKDAFRKQYVETKPELRNERGTIAFLIGRELRDGHGDSADVGFLKSVLMEKPCLSLQDCSKANSGSGPEEQHLEAIHETTAHYPQLMGLRYLKQALESGNLSPSMREEVLATLAAARQSPNARVAQEAQAILSAITQP